MYSIVKCDELPLPTDAKLYLPGSFLSNAISSRIEFAGNCTLAAMTFGCEVVVMTAIKSFSGW